MMKKYDAKDDGMITLVIDRDMDGRTALQMLYLFGNEGIKYEIDWYEYNKVHIDATPEQIHDVLDGCIDSTYYELE